MKPSFWRRIQMMSAGYEDTLRRASGDTIGWLLITAIKGRTVGLVIKCRHKTKIDHVRQDFMSHLIIYMN